MASQTPTPAAPPQIQREFLHDCWGEIATLAYEHYLEIAVFRDIPFDPDKDRYLRLEDAGMIHCFTVRDAGVLIGYAVFIAQTNGHYQSSLQAVQDVLYLHNDYRRTGLARELICFCDQELRVAGVQVVYQHVKPARDFSKLLESEGYQLVERVYARKLS